MSPLSDTTNSAALVTRVNIFAHIKSMMWTTIPASIIGLIVWFFGLHSGGNANPKQIQMLLSELDKVYNINLIVDTTYCYCDLLIIESIYSAIHAHFKSKCFISGNV